MDKDEYLRRVADSAKLENQPGFFDNLKRLINGQAKANHNTVSDPQSPVDVQIPKPDPEQLAEDKLNPIRPPVSPPQLLSDQMQEAPPGFSERTPEEQEAMLQKLYFMNKNK